MAFGYLSAKHKVRQHQSAGAAVRTARQSARFSRAGHCMAALTELLGAQREQGRAAGHRDSGSAPSNNIRTASKAIEVARREFIKHCAPNVRPRAGGIIPGW